LAITERSTENVQGYLEDPRLETGIVSEGIEAAAYPEKGFLGKIVAVLRREATAKE
jgi:hypothetical protein